MVKSVMVKKKQGKWICLVLNNREQGFPFFDGSDDLLDGMMRYKGLCGESVTITMSTKPYPFFSFEVSRVYDDQNLYRCEALNLEGRVNSQLLTSLGDYPENLYLNFHNPKFIDSKIEEVVDQRKITILVEMDHVLIDVHSAFGALYKDIRDNLNGQKRGMKSILEVMNPIDGAIDGMLYLREKFLPIITHFDEYNNPFSNEDRIAWIKQYVNSTDTLFPFRGSQEVIPEYSYLITAVHPIKIPRDFKGSQIKFGSKEFPSWVEIITYFRSFHL